MKLIDFFKGQKYPLLIPGIIAAVIISAAVVTTVFLSKPKTEITTESAELEPSQPSRAEIMTTTLAACYPNRIEKAEFRDDDWAVLMDGVWYYFSGGRMLPEELREKTEEYSGSINMPNYQSGELPPWTELTPEQSARYAERNSERNRNRDNSDSENPRPRRQRTYHFRDALWQSPNRNEAEKQMKTVDFLGKKMPIHSDLTEILSLVEERILTAAETEPSVQSWVTGIGELYGWNWRNIAGSQSRSNHSYGIAIDILPKTLNGKETYWQWASGRKADWWNIPYEDRYHPPNAVINAFEAHGFIWGGKWGYFDTMHFEYRPEVFILARSN